MVENVLLFRTKEKYIDPKYRKQMEEWDKKQNLERGHRIAGAMAEAEKGNILKALAQSLSIGSGIREEIKEGDTSAFPYLLGLAILVYLVDFIPVVGTIVVVVAWPILFWGTFMRGRIKYKWGIRAIFLILNFLGIVPGISYLPLEPLAILLLWRDTAKRRREKEAEEEENSQEVVSLADRIKQVGQKYENMSKKWAAANKAARSSTQKTDNKQPISISEESEYKMAA